GGRIVEIAEAQRAGGAGFHASRNVIGRIDFALAGGGGFLLRGVPAAVAEIAFLDHAPHARRNVGVERFLHAGRPCRVPPIEIARVVRAGDHAIAAAQAALRHLADDAGFRVHVHRLLRADVYARRVVAALLAEDGHERGAALRISTVVIHLVNANPGDALSIIGGFGHRRDVVLHRAGHHAGAAAVALVDIDRHAVASHSAVSILCRHTRTTRAVRFGPYRSTIRA